MKRISVFRAIAVAVAVVARQCLARHPASETAAIAGLRIAPRIAFDGAGKISHHLGLHFRPAGQGGPVKTKEALLQSGGNRAGEHRVIGEMAVRADQLLRNDLVITAFMGGTGNVAQYRPAQGRMSACAIFRTVYSDRKSVV